MKKIILIVSVLIFFSCSSEKESVSELAFIDQIWGPTYNAIAGKIQNNLAGDVSIYQMVADSVSLDAQDARNLLIFATRYTANAFSVEKVNFRYPHYNPDSIQHDLDRLETLDLIESTTAESYRLTTSGQATLNYYWEIKKGQAQNFDLLSDQDVEALYLVVRKIVDAALGLEDGFKNESVKFHENSLPQGFDRFPKVVQVVELLWQFIAFVNDTAHYKYDNYINASGDSDLNRFLSLSALSKELMGATSRGRAYDINRCYTHRVWRMGKGGCDLAVDELLEFGLLEKSGNTVKHTEYGALLSKNVEEAADRRRYSTWKEVTSQEYDQYVKVIRKLNESKD